VLSLCRLVFFHFSVPPRPQSYPLSLHDALPIYIVFYLSLHARQTMGAIAIQGRPEQRFQVFHGLFVIDAFVHSLLQEGFQLWIRSEEHTSELQSRENLVCRLLLEKKKR